MNPLLILILIPIVIFIGYILSRPFESPPDYQFGTTKKDDLQDRYDSILREIKLLQSKVEQSDHPLELENQIKAKKRKAAELLRQLKPDLDNETTS